MLSNPLPSIQDLKHQRGLFYAEHALIRMIQRNLTIARLDAAIDSIESEIIEVYPQIGRQSPECLIMGKDGEGRFLHVLVAYPGGTVITAYEPSLPKWMTPRERRLDK